VQRTNKTQYQYIDLLQTAFKICNKTSLNRKIFWLAKVRLNLKTNIRMLKDFTALVFITYAIWGSTNHKDLIVINNMLQKLNYLYNWQRPGSQNRLFLKET
jgi:G:T-mismatch repair DNA endonuclease (very short patch repair protein)